MRLKSLASLVCIALALQFLLSLYNAISRHYMTPMYAFQLALNVPLILFFFFVWKRQKEPAGP